VCKVVKLYATKYRAAWESKPRDKYPAAKKRRETKHKSVDRTWTRAEVQAIMKKVAASTTTNKHEVHTMESEDHLDSDDEKFAKIFKDMEMNDTVDLMDYSDSD